MANLKAFLDLCRISNLPTVWTNVLAALVLSGVSFTGGDFLILAISLSLFYSGGMCLNDLYDAEIDRKEKPFRPIPSGRISPKAVEVFTLFLFVIALSLLLPTRHPSALFAGLVLLGLIVAYDKSHKKSPASVFLMAGCRLMVFVVTGLAISGTVTGAVWTGGLAQFLYILVLSLVARSENRSKIKFAFPVIPYMLAGISLLDGLLMGFGGSPAWFPAGVGGTVLTLFGQKYVRGD
jgi:4-hydroxybenzoate polyprenyltransferase